MKGCAEGGTYSQPAAVLLNNPPMATNHRSRSVNDKSCFSLTFTTFLQVVRPFYSILDFLCCLSEKIIQTMLEKHNQNAQQEQLEGWEGSKHKVLKHKVCHLVKNSVCIKISV